MKAMRIPCAHLFSPFALLLVVFLAACADDSTIVSPAPDDTVVTSGPAPDSEAFAYTQVFTSSDRCRLPRSNYARFARTLDAIAPGDFALDADSGWVSCNDAPDDANATFTWAEDQGRYTWTSSVPIGAICLWSGDRGIVYDHYPDAFENVSIVGPPDPVTGQPMPVDAVTIYHDYALDVQLDVQTTGGGGTSWRLGADVIPVEWDLLPGDRGTSRAFVTLDRTVAPSGAPRADGTVIIDNPAPRPTTIVRAYAVIGFGAQVQLELPQEPPFVLEANTTLEATFAYLPPSASPADVQVIVEASGDVESGRASGTIAFGDGPQSVTLVSSDGQRFGPFSGSEQIAIDRTFTTDDIGPADWTIAVEGVDGAVTTLPILVRAHEPTITPLLQPRFARSWDWTLSVELDDTRLPIADPFDGFVPMRARVASIPGPDMDHALGGNLELFNPHPTRELVLDSIALDVEGIGFDLTAAVTVPAGGRVLVAVDAPLGGAAAQATARARYAAREISWNQVVASGAFVDLSGTIGLSFDAPTSVIDASARLSDDRAGDLGAIQASTAPSLVAFDVSVDPMACGAITVAGASALLTTDRRIEITTDYALVLDVPCAVDVCTRSMGAWRERPNDLAWDRLPGTVPAALAMHGLTWRDALGPLRSGGVFGQLAAQYVAVHLNAASGADASVVSAALDDAEAWLAAHTPGAPAGRDAKDAAHVAKALRDFNEGAVGPGACQD